MADVKFVKNFISGYKKKLKECVDTISEDDVAKIIGIIMEAGKKKKSIFLAGNGGSAAISSHMTCDLSKTVLKGKDDLDRMAVYCLSDNVPFMTAISNDWGYEHSFSEQLKNLIREGDVLILISSSGNSPNIVNAAEYAKSKKAIVVGLTGFAGGKLKQLADYGVHININDYGIVEDLHMSLDHMISFCIKKLRE